MSYIIHKSDNKTKIAEVPDGSIDQYSTDITLIGKNYSGFGQVLNENFVKLLENFASTDYPAHPIKGQLWYDSTAKALKVYSGTSFVPVSSATVSSTGPVSPGIGDLWYNDSNKQLFYWNGTEQVLLGPTYTDSQLLSGLKTLSVLDSVGNTRVVTCLYNNGRLMGLYANDNFTLENPSAIAGFTGPISIGFNVGTLYGFKINATSTNSDNLGGLPASSYVKTTTTNALSGQLRVTTDAGIIVGASGTASLTVNAGSVILANTIQSNTLALGVKNSTNTQEKAIVITPSNGSTAGTVAVDSAFTLTVGGDIVINGNLDVNGTTTSIDTTNITVEDKNIVLAKHTGTTPTDSNASGGGVIVQGASSHGLIWSATNQVASASSPEAISGGYTDNLPILSENCWNSTEHFNLAAGKEFKINGVTVLTGTSLGSVITSIPGVTSFGTQSVVNIGPDDTYIRLTGNTISTQQPNQDLRIAPSGSGSNIGNVALIASSTGIRPRITGVAYPVDRNDAANLEYVDNQIKSQNLALSIDITESTTIANIQGIIDQLMPVQNYIGGLDGVKLRVLCSTIGYSSGITITRTIEVFIISANQWVHDSTITIQ
jgi:hypothetical protein